MEGESSRRQREGVMGRGEEGRAEAGGGSQEQEQEVQDQEQGGRGDHGKQGVNLVLGEFRPRAKGRGY